MALSWSSVGIVADQLFPRSDKMMVRAGPSLPSRDRIIVVDQHDQFSLGQDSSNIDGDLIVQSVTSIAQVADVLASAADMASVVLVNLDAVTGLDDAVDGLLDLRKTYPFTTIVIASRDFRQSDLSSDRRAIADVSIKLPVSESFLQIAISTAIGNHERDKRERRIMPVSVVAPEMI